MLKAWYVLLMTLADTREGTSSRVAHVRLLHPLTQSLETARAKRRSRTMERKRGR